MCGSYEKIQSGWEIEIGFKATAKAQYRLANCIRYILYYCFYIISFSLIHLLSVNDSKATAVGGITIVSTGGKFTAGVKNLTWNHNLTAGTNQLLIVSVTTQDKPVSSVTVGGVAMNNTYGSITKSSMEVSIYYLFNPGTGTKQIKVTTSNNTDVAAGSVQLDGVSTGSSFTVTTNSGVGNSASSGSVSTNSASVVISVLGDIQRNPSVPTYTTVYSTGGTHYNTMAMRLGTSSSASIGYTFSSSTTWGTVSLSLSSILLLPVTWKSFEIEEHNSVPVANWVTASETNNDHFEIETSKDGSEFSRYDIVPGNGNSTHDIAYEYKFDKGIREDLYVRIKQVDYDGKFSYSQSRFVKGTKEQSDFLLYPTIVSDHVNIRCSFENIVLPDRWNIELWILPEKLFATDNSMSQNFQIRLLVGSSEMIKGQYFLALYTDAGEMMQKRFLKE
ncbi:MAG: hypothetical protein U0X76_09935 [Bacteroidia bacterium]